MDMDMDDNDEWNVVEKTQGNYTYRKDNGK